MRTQSGVLIQTRSFGERLADTIVRGVVVYTNKTDEQVYKAAEEFLLENTFIGNYAKENDQKVVFKWMHFEGRIWLFDKNFDMTEFDEARDYAREIIFSPAFYVYLPSISVGQVD